MTLHPEQLRALDYLKRKGTEAPVDELRRQIAGTFLKIEKAIDAVPASLREASPGPGRWSVHEILDHLVESHRPALGQLRSLLEGRSPETPAIPASLQSADPLSRPWEKLVYELDRIHDTLWDFLRDATDAQPMDVRAPMVIVLKVTRPDGTLERLQWEERLDWKAFIQALRVHTLEHLSQITRTLEDLGEPASSQPE